MSPTPRSAKGWGTRTPSFNFGVWWQTPVANRCRSAEGSPFDLSSNEQGPPILGDP